MSKDIQPRQPKGIPIGGQFANREHGEAGLSLAEPATPSARSAVIEHLFRDAERHDALLNRGYVKPTFAAADVSPHAVERRQEWWERHFLIAGHDAEGGGYPKMPDNYTPSKRSGNTLGGRSEEGELHTYRRTFVDDGVSIQMPSMASIKAYSKEVGTSFTVPVRAQDESGRIVDCEVLVTNNGAGVWSAEALGISGVANAKISEAVASRLESRRRRQEARAIGDLQERYRARLAAQGATVEPVKSGWISAVGYNEQAGLMVTQTSNGNVYGHHVDAKTFAAVRGSKSPGAMFNTLVKGHGGASVANCAKCGRFYAEAKGHGCPTTAAPPPPGTKHANQVQRAAAERVAARAAAARAAVVPPGVAARMPVGDAAPKGSSAAAAPVTAPAPAPEHRRDPDARDSRLAEQFAEALAGPTMDPDRGTVFGPERGFTRAASETLEPYTSQTYAPLYFGEKFGQPGEFYRNDRGNPAFAGLAGDDARRVRDSLPPENLDVRQADEAPSLGSALAVAADHPDQVEVHGYTVLPYRSDERVTAEGIHLYDVDGSLDSPDAVYDRMRALGLDFTGTADEIHEVENSWRPGTRTWRVWWD